MCQDFTIRPARIEALALKILFRERIKQLVKFRLTGIQFNNDLRFYFLLSIIHAYPRFASQSNNFFVVQVLITSFGSSHARRAMATP